MQINSSAPRISVPFSMSGAKNTIPVNASDQTLASYAIGFPPITAIPVASGGVPPTCKDFNGILYDLSNAIMWLQAMGVLPWDSTVSYPNGAFVSYNGDMYYSVSDDNVGITPGTNDAKWVTRKPVINTNDHAIKIGWSGSRLKATIDTTDIGNIVFDKNLSGQVGYFAMTTPPQGWMKANGAAVSRSAYSSLFAAIGTTFGAGDGSTTFNLPDLRGEFLRGFDDGRGVDNNRVFGSWQVDDFLSHKHISYFGDTPDAITYPNGYYSTGNPGSSASHDMDNAYPYTSNTGGVETRPRNISFLACIKY